MKSQQTGFTLVEIAIVLVIIGLLLGGVLKGQELINSAKVKNMANDFRNVPVFIYGYQDKFRALPGDDPAAQGHLGATATQIALVSASGTAGNGRIDGLWTSAAVADESYVFWQHVRLANLASGPSATVDPSYRPTNADGGFIGIESVSQPTATKSYITGMSGTYLLCSMGILGKFAKQLDAAMDNGNGSTGQMRIVPNTGYTRGGSAGLDNITTPADIDDSTQYTVCMAF